MTIFLICLAVVALILFACCFKAVLVKHHSWFQCPHKHQELTQVQFNGFRMHICQDCGKNWYER